MKFPRMATRNDYKPVNPKPIGRNILVPQYSPIWDKKLWSYWGRNCKMFE